ncbi:thiol-disulfide oxidoreductase LTO1-like [Bidens hawaiensis]|uniref:thiol-disulfide oxidoreductase LTO1-like n=1 Tax=Bidens hawaiensis TaxID=980011 RepID=UPI004049E572
MATFINLSSSYVLSRRKHSPLVSSSHQLLKSHSGGYSYRSRLTLKCLNDPTTTDDDDDAAVQSQPTSAFSSYTWSAALGGLGLLETAYLTYSKLSGSDAFCPVAGGSCGDILNSHYALVYGIPLPVIGMVAYGTTTFLALKLASKDFPFGIEESNGGLILLGTTTAMATASAYFLYILNTQFPGASCSYCLVSVFLSFSLFLTTAKTLGWQKIRDEVGLLLCIAGLVFAALSNSYSATITPPARFGEKFLPYFPTEIKAQSSPLALKLAAHLRSVGAKMYGAFWCSHCLEQKEMFGHEAAKLVDYVECFPDGFKTGTDLSQECKKVKIEGFPMWIINGQTYKGIQDFSELAKASGFEDGEFSRELAEIAKQSAEADMQP